MKCSKISIFLIILGVILLILGIVLIVMGIRKKSKENNDKKTKAMHSWHGLTGGEEDPGLGWVL
jgi:uncharacterized membrane protein